MLLLTRQQGQSVEIDGEIKVTVVEVRPGGVVMLGFEAPASTRIVRSEIRDRPKRDATGTGSKVRR